MIQMHSFLKVESLGETRCRKSWNQFKGYDSLSLRYVMRVSLKKRTIVGKNKCQSSSRSQEETERQQRFARSKAWNLGKTFTSSKKKTRLYFYFPAKNGYSRLRQHKSQRNREEATVYVKQLDYISSEMANELIAIHRTMYHLWFPVYQRVLPQLHFHLPLHHLHLRIPYLMSTDTPKIWYHKEVAVRVETFGETRCMKAQKPKTKIKMENQKKPRARKSRHFQVISWTSNGAAS